MLASTDPRDQHQAVTNKRIQESPVRSRQKETTELRGFGVGALVAGVCLTAGADIPIVMSLPPSEWVMDWLLAFLIGMELMVTVVCAAIFGFIPFVVAIAIAEARHIKSPYYYCLFGLVTGVLCDVVLTAWSSSQLPVGDPDHLTFGTGFLRFLPILLAAGLGGSGTYWFVAGRKLN
jgi:hypothetical protein